MATPRMDDFFQYNFQHHLHDTILTTEKYFKIKEFPQYFSVRRGAKRLDAIAYNIYGNHDYWIYLAVYNDLRDPFDLPGQIWFIPPVELNQIIA